MTSGAIGSALEYFDFALYGVLSATLFPQLFFGDLGPTGSVLASFATFGVGFAARPIGALLFGYLGDRFGRKPILLTTLVMMGLASVAIGLLPTGQGVVVATILVGLRFIQGVSLGGELVGNQLMTMEHGNQSRRGLLGSVITLGSPLSQVFANLALVALSATLTTEQFESWGWRVPFLSSILLVFVAMFIRAKLEETPAFVVEEEMRAEAPSTGGKGLAVLRSHPRTVITLVLALGGSALSFYLVAVYGLNHLTSNTGMSRGSGFLLLMIANAVSIVGCIGGGWLSDKIGRKPVWIGSIISTMVGIAVFFPFSGPDNYFITGASMSLVLISLQAIAGVQPAVFAEQFPTEVRFSGAALSHSISNLIFSSPSAFIAAALSTLGGPGLVTGFTLAILVVSGIAVTRTRDGRNLDLAAYTELDKTGDDSSASAWKGSAQTA
ncbi:MHS family MFS transporter [Rhodococcus sp. 14C212]|uniref:MFS transporter n=1 Tax=Rhodococcus sp. 14C212 TaxID=2711209 RepID=UPI0013EDB6F3|nr:MHS family MFS transporter [Rhodococcus sp. 14C212]